MADWLGGIGNIVSAFIGADAAESQRAAENDRFIQNLAAQREFAQHGIQWKVADARAAGIHPMFALGASTTSYAPQALGDIGTDMRKSMGQDIARAASAIGSTDQKETDQQKAMGALQLERAGLENELLKSQITRVRQDTVKSQPSVVPTPGGGVALLGGDVPQGAANDPIKAAPGPEHVGVDPGATWLHNPNFSDAQKTEDRYGDIGEEVKGAFINFPADLYWNMMNSPTFYGPLSRAGARWASARRRASGDWYVSKRYRD